MSRYNDSILRQLSSKVDPGNDKVVRSLANAYKQASIEADIKDEVHRVVNGFSGPSRNLTISESGRSFFGFANMVPKGARNYGTTKLLLSKTGYSSPKRILTKKVKQYIEGRSVNIRSNRTLRSLELVRKNMLQHRLQPLALSGK